MNLNQLLSQSQLQVIVYVFNRVAQMSNLIEVVSNAGELS